MVFQRYVSHLPAAGEIVLFDRSWYNRAGVERVMGFCDDAQYEEFFRTVPEFEKMLVRSGIQLIKYWFSISDEEQHMRFLGRIHDPLKQWKLSPMDLESRLRWEAYTRAKEIMLERTHIPEARWWVVQAVDKKRAWLNCIHHMLSQMPYREIEHARVRLPDRVHHDDYVRRPVPQEIVVPEIYWALDVRCLVMAIPEGVSPRLPRRFVRTPHDWRTTDFRPPPYPLRCPNAAWRASGHPRHRGPHRRQISGGAHPRLRRHGGRRGRTARRAAPAGGDQAPQARSPGAAGGAGALPPRGPRRGGHPERACGARRRRGDAGDRFALHRDGVPLGERLPHAFTAGAPGIGFYSEGVPASQKFSFTQFSATGL